MLEEHRCGNIVFLESRPKTKLHVGNDCVAQSRAYDFNSGKLIMCRSNGLLQVKRKNSSWFADYANR